VTNSTTTNKKQQDPLALALAPAQSLQPSQEVTVIPFNRGFDLTPREEDAVTQYDYDSLRMEIAKRKGMRAMRCISQAHEFALDEVDETVGYMIERKYEARDAEHQRTLRPGEQDTGQAVYRRPGDNLVIR
jgi:hypothetical protein